MTELNIGEQGERVYLPSAIAESQGLVDLSQPFNLDSPPGVFIANGQKPAASNGGVVEIGGRIWGIDHAAVMTPRVGSEIVFTGTDKSAIEVSDPETNLGVVKQEGAITITDLDAERVIISALFKIDDGWTRERFRKMGLTTHRIGRFVIGMPGFSSAVPRVLGIKKLGDDEIITKPLYR